MDIQALLAHGRGDTSIARLALRANLNATTIQDHEAGRFTSIEALTEHLAALDPTAVRKVAAASTSPVQGAPLFVGPSACRCRTTGSLRGNGPRSFVLTQGQESVYFTLTPAQRDKFLDLIEHAGRNGAITITGGTLTVSPEPNSRTRISVQSRGKNLHLHMDHIRLHAFWGAASISRSLDG